MYDEHVIVQQVYAARRNPLAADDLISSYLPFIRSETAKFLKRPPIDGQDDELSIAMIAFHEAIEGYQSGRGAFLNYAALLIRSRLVDYVRKEARHAYVDSLDAPTRTEDITLGETIADQTDRADELMTREAARGEILELTRQMQMFGVSLTDVSENCPRQERTLHACQTALAYARSNPELIKEFLKTKRVPLTKLAKGSGVSKKTLERHRKYLVALLLIFSNGYELIRGHLKQIKGGVQS
jgi:RNA polymerase sigma-I factor